MLGQGRAKYQALKVGGTYVRTAAVRRFDIGVGWLGDLHKFPTERSLDCAWH